MGYDIIVVVCVIFALLLTLVGIHFSYVVVFEGTARLYPSFRVGDAIKKWILRIVGLPLMLVLVFFFLSIPIMWILGFALGASFHGS